MKKSERRARVEERLHADGEVLVSELAGEFEVSEMTIRRDLEALESAGVARRIRNGAISLSLRSAEPQFDDRLGAAAAAKAAIGQRAADLVADGETIVVDGGTTCLALARWLRARELAVTVITPGMLTALELAADPRIRVVLPGGSVRTTELSLIGSDTEEFFGDYNCDVFFVSSAGADVTRGLTDYNRDEARVKRAAMECSRRVVALLDQRKLDEIYFARVTPLEAVDVLVTDAAPDHPFVVRAEQMGIEVLTVVAEPDRPLAEMLPPEQAPSAAVRT